MDVRSSQVILMEPLVDAKIAILQVPGTRGASPRLREQILSDDHWLNEHWTELVASYPDRFIAVHLGEVVGDSADLMSLEARMRERRIEQEALVVFVDSAGVPRLD